MIFSSLQYGLFTEMSKFSLPLCSLKHSEPFRGTVLPCTTFVFLEYCVQLRQFQSTYPVKGSHERVRPLVISQDTIRYPATCTDDLHRYSDQPMEKPPKLHSKKLIPMLPSAHQKRKPCFESPGQGGHHHIGPVGQQVIHRHPQRIDCILELLN